MDRFENRGLTAVTRANEYEQALVGWKDPVKRLYGLFTIEAVAATRW